MVSTTASTDMPARSASARRGVEHDLDRQALRDLGEVPVALLGATGDRLRPVAGAMLCTVPRSRQVGIGIHGDGRGLAGSHVGQLFSRKFATT